MVVMADIEAELAEYRRSQFIELMGAAERCGGERVMALLMAFSSGLVPLSDIDDEFHILGRSGAEGRLYIHGVLLLEALSSISTDSDEWQWCLAAFQRELGSLWGYRSDEDWFVLTQDQQERLNGAFADIEALALSAMGLAPDDLCPSVWVTENLDVYLDLVPTHKATRDLSIQMKHLL